MKFKTSFDLVTDMSGWSSGSNACKPSVTVQRKAFSCCRWAMCRARLTICTSSELSNMISGVRERMIASRSRMGLSVNSAPMEECLDEGKFIQCDQGRSNGKWFKQKKRLRPPGCENKKPREKSPGFLKDWRLPTLAEAIQPLPSAMQCLTAVFGMGTGRTTAVLPPKLVCTVFDVQN